MELYALQDRLEDIRALGAELIAISPQTVEQNAKVQHKLRFPLLSDQGNQYAKTLGIAATYSEELKEVYRGFPILLPEFNGDETWTLPIPTRLVIDSSGILRSIHADPDYTRRPDVESSLQVLEKLK